MFSLLPSCRCSWWTELGSFDYRMVLHRQFCSGVPSFGSTRLNKAAQEPNSERFSWDAFFSAWRLAKSTPRHDSVYRLTTHSRLLTGSLPIITRGLRGVPQRHARGIPR